MLIINSEYYLSLGVKSPCLKNHNIRNSSGTKIKYKKIKDFSPKFRYHLNKYNNALDIQRNCYFPGTKQIYTFVGYKKQTLSQCKQEIIDTIYCSNEYDINIYTYSVASHSNNGYSSSNSNSNQQKNETDFDVFVPK